MNTETYKTFDLKPEILAGFIDWVNKNSKVANCSPERVHLWLDGDNFDYDLECGCSVEIEIPAHQSVTGHMVSFTVMPSDCTATDAE